MPQRILGKSSDDFLLSKDFFSPPKFQSAMSQLCAIWGIAEVLFRSISTRRIQMFGLFLYFFRGKEAPNTNNLRGQGSLEKGGGGWEWAFWRNYLS